ncbi:MAG: phosphoserine transaminase, partial [Alphaproteobacteria bacterium]|nr:phosphoserine transaminase [Alphaproteobacteria bacterium]
PKGYRVGIVAGSDTGAVEMCLWSMLGGRGVDMLAWESFSSGWVTDVVKQLKLKDVNVYEADYGKLPDVSKVNFDNDVVFAWNGTTSGACLPNGDWIASDRKGITICDATSAVFAMDMPWEKLDVTTFSWQKVLGGEAAHGVIILSPRAVERLESYTPSWPMPKTFRMTKGGKLIEGIFEGSPINTPSMLCVEDVIDALKWAENLGGKEGLLSRTKANLKAFENWVEKTEWIEFLAETKETRSSTSICFSIVAPWFTALDAKEKTKAAKKISALLDKEDVAYDINSYKDAPAGIRVWGGATVETSDIEALCPWLDWAYENVKSEYAG